MDELQEVFSKKLKDISEMFPENISAIHGKGMVYAVHFVNPITKLPDGLSASKISELCMQNGLLVVHTGRESIKLGPPLVIEMEALIEGLDVLKDCIQVVVNE